MHRQFAARLFLTALALFSFSMRATAGKQTLRTFTCDGGTSFSVVVADKVADVTFSRSEYYRLRSKPFSIGQRFVSPTATLIIDGRLAVFVSNGRIDLNQCELKG
jgi:hypothetical protein